MVGDPVVVGPRRRIAYIPLTGNQRRLTEKISTRINPSQKDGVESPVRTAKVSALSCQPYWRTADMTPAASPRMVQRISEASLASDRA